VSSQPPTPQTGPKSRTARQDVMSRMTLTLGTSFPWRNSRISALTSRYCICETFSRKWKPLNESPGHDDSRTRNFITAGQKVLLRGYGADSLTNFELHREGTKCC
jgi:hypothetical protein